MTNEEKANEISERRKDKHCVEYHCYRSALEMAQWKDKQIDTILLTTEGCLRSFFESRGNTSESIDNFIDALKTQINENINKL